MKATSRIEAERAFRELQGPSNEQLAARAWFCGMEMAGAFTKERMTSVLRAAWSTVGLIHPDPQINPITVNIYGARASGSRAKIISFLSLLERQVNIEYEPTIEIDEGEEPTSGDSHAASIAILASDDATVSERTAAADMLGIGIVTPIRSRTSRRAVSAPRPFRPAYILLPANR